ncbi:hypothetical protein CEE45_01510 [Candidatus Heimdallarchaeota archaeon B3_Heim]|nr:MAG: hypothetical protein CEE45_01510 [Candidatus Heimdallarchaeota archaeon B3_Heim]
MNNGYPNLERRLKLLENYQVFLGLILALVMQIMWDFLDRESLTPRFLFLSIGFFILSVFCLINICGFYFLLYVGNKTLAVKIGGVNLVLVPFIFIGLLFFVSALILEQDFYEEGMITAFICGLMILGYVFFLRHQTRKYFRKR